MKPLGYIAWKGRSRIDGRPIVVIINKIDEASANDKTGALIQSFILRSDVPPMEAIHTGTDRSICGDCEHRPILAKQTGRPPCYVAVWQAPRSVYDAYKRGRYERATPAQPQKKPDAGQRARRAYCALAHQKPRDIVIADHATGHKRRVIQLQTA